MHISRTLVFFPIFTLLLFGIWPMTGIIPYFGDSIWGYNGLIIGISVLSLILLRIPNMIWSNFFMRHHLLTPEYGFDSSKWIRSIYNINTIIQLVSIMEFLGFNLYLIIYRIQPTEVIDSLFMTVFIGTIIFSSLTTVWFNIAQYRYRLLQRKRGNYEN